MTETLRPKPVHLPPFSAWLASNIPAVYDNTMSYYEELTSLLKWLEAEVVPNVNEAITLANTLREYVEKYFENLDVQEEINNKLDQMAEDGTLQEIISEYIQANVAWTFDTVADMKASTNLVANSYAKTLGFHTLNDGGGATYYITDTGVANEQNIIAVGELFANLVIDPKELNVKQFGAYGDGTHDDLASIQATIDYGRNNSYNNVLIPSGRYIVSNAIEIPETMHISGDTLDTTSIVKSTNNLNPTDNVDAIIIFRKTSGYSGSYTERQSIANISIEGNNSNTYGIYCYTPCPRSEINYCKISKVVKGIQISRGWLFVIKNTSVQPTQDGIIIGGSSTTLNMENTYVYGGTGYGYKLNGIGYSSLRNIACDANTGTPYQLDSCNLVINGFGCECPNANYAIKGDGSHVEINNGTVVVNPSLSGYECIFIAANSTWCLNEVIFHDYGAASETAGKFLHTGSGANIAFNNCRIDKKFATANIYYANDTTQKLSDRNGEFTVNGQNDICGLGNIQTDNFALDFYSKTNMNANMGGILFNNRGSVRYSLNGTDRAYKASHNLGDIFVNQAPALNGVAFFQQTSDSVTRAINGTISALSISGSTGTITMTSLNLEDFAKNRGLVVESGHTIKSSSGGTASISAVDNDTNTLTLTSVSGTFAVGDNVDYDGFTRIGTTKFANIQSIGYGTTAQRPSSPVNGYMYWDTTLGKAIWRVGNNWKDATGTNV